MVDPSILNTDAFKIIEKAFEKAFKICDICLKMEYRGNVLKLKESDKRYDQDLLKKCRTNTSDWICTSCQKKTI